MAEQNVSFKKSMFGFRPKNVMTYVDELLKATDFDQIKIAELEKAISEKDSEIDKLKGIISHMREQAENEANAKADMCKGCTVERKAQELLGETMLDVRRFSSSLVSEAKQQAQHTINEAQTTAGEASEKAKELLTDVDGISDNVLSQFDELRTILASLTNNLDSFCGSIDISDAEQIAKKNVYGEDSEMPDFVNTSSAFASTAEKKAEAVPFVAPAPADIHFADVQATPAITSAPVSPVDPVAAVPADFDEDPFLTEISEAAAPAELIMPAAVNQSGIPSVQPSVESPVEAPVNSVSYEAPENQIPVNIIRNNETVTAESPSPFEDLFDASPIDAAPAFKAPAATPAETVVPPAFVAPAAPATAPAETVAPPAFVAPAAPVAAPAETVTPPAFVAPATPVAAPAETVVPPAFAATAAPAAAPTETIVPPAFPAPASNEQTAPQSFSIPAFTAGTQFNSDAAPAPVMPSGIPAFNMSQPVEKTGLPDFSAVAAPDSGDDSKKNEAFSYVNTFKLKPNFNINNNPVAEDPVPED